MPKPERYLNRLRGRVAIVTGAGSRGNGVGIGRAISILFAGEGARVCLVDRDKERIENTAAIIASENGECMVCVADVTSGIDCREIVARTVDHFGGIDILVNNVGIATRAGTLEGLAEAEWRSVFDINVSSTFLMSKAAVPHLLTRAGGSIVNIASIAGERAHGAAAYGTSKAALIAFTRELAVIYGRAGLRANAIAPGHVYTPLVADAIDDDGRRLRRDIAPLSIEGDAWDIATACLFLAGDEARFITGVCLDVDGGVMQVAPLAAHQRVMTPST